MAFSHYHQIFNNIFFSFYPDFLLVFYQERMNTLIVCALRNYGKPNLTGCSSIKYFQYISKRLILGCDTYKLKAKHLFTSY